MPARTGNTTYVPGRGATTVKPSGKKTFVGKGPAPAGASKQRERSYSEVPTLTVTSRGTRATGFSSPNAAKRAAMAQAASARRVKRIVRAFTPKPPTGTVRLPGAIPQTPFTKAQLHPEEKKVGEHEVGAHRSQVNYLHQLESKLKEPAPEVPPVSKPRVPSQRKQAVKKVKIQLQKLKSAGKPGHLPYLETPEQQKVAKTVLRTGQKMKADRKEKLASIETGIVESGFKNLPGGDASSKGWRQELSTLYPEPNNVKTGAKNFFTETKTDTGGTRGKGQTPGQLAQTVQASAYPERYDEHAREARQILHAFNQGKKTPAQQAKLKRVEAKAERLGVNPKAPALGPAPKKVVTRYKAGLHAAKELAHAHIPYVWGGGHGSPTSSPTGGGLDCSGAVSYVLNKMGVMKGALTSGSMGSVLKPGPGAVTVFYNAEHTFMSFGGKFFGTSVNDSSKGLAFYKNPGSAYLSQYSVGHVPGLGKKQALQMGLATPESSPGMTLAPSGTSATINSGAGTTQSTPGFSNAPIRLTRRQQVQRTTRELKELGAPLEGRRAATKNAAGKVSIAELEAKYGTRH